MFKRLKSECGVVVANDGNKAKRGRRLKRSKRASKQTQAPPATPQTPAPSVLTPLSKPDSILKSLPTNDLPPKLESSVDHLSLGTLMQTISAPSSGYVPVGEELRENSVLKRGQAPPPLVGEGEGKGLGEGSSKSTGTLGDSKGGPVAKVIPVVSKSIQSDPSPDRAVIAPGLDIGSFSWFGVSILQLPLYACQRAVLDDLDPPGAKVSAKCANGVGKTTMLSAPAILAHALLYQGSQTVTTSGVFRQVKEQMWPAIRRLATQFRGLGVDPNLTDFKVTRSNGKTSSVIGFSTDDPGKFEGWHADSLMVVLDEAKTIPDSIFEAVERCSQGQPTRILMLSSPGPSQGAFYRSHTREANLWKRHTITAYQCPHIDKAETEKLIQKWGLDHPLIRSMVFAEFMDIGADTLVIRETDYRNCLANPPMKKGSERVAFCDFAAGGDENAFAFREGNIIRDLTAWGERDTMKALARFIQLFRRFNLEPSEIYADAGGMGIPMCDRLSELGWAVNRVNNGSKAYDDKDYANRGTEIWMNAARLIQTCEVQVPDDEITISQACSRKLTYDTKGRLMVEQKEVMRKRGVSSPDRFDAVAGAIACGRIHHDIVSNFVRPSFLELLEDQEADGQFAGFDCGM